MSWSVVVRPEAESDIAEATGWYEARREGLGRSFAKQSFTFSIRWLIIHS